MLSVKCTGRFFVHLVAIAFLCSITVLNNYAQELETGATPPWTSGEPGAPITIEIFNDYQCAPCSTANEQLKKVEATYSKQVRHE